MFLYYTYTYVFFLVVLDINVSKGWTLHQHKCRLGTNKSIGGLDTS